MPYPRRVSLASARAAGRAIGWRSAAAAAPFAATAGILIWSRVTGLGMGLWHDELVTVTAYVGRGPGEILAGDYLPNNHVLFSILTWLTTRALGTSEVALRLWAVLPSIAAFLGLGVWAFRRFGATVGTATLLLLTVSPLLLDLSKLARGYGLAFVGIALMLTGAIDRRPLRYATGGAIAIFTLPILALPFAFTGVVLLADARTRVPTLAALGIVIVASLGWYAMLLPGLLASTDQTFGDQLAWHGPLTAPVQHHVVPLLDLFALERPRAWDAVAWIAVLLGVAAAARRSRAVTSALGLAVVGTYLVIAVLGISVFVRFMLPLAIPMLLLVALGSTLLAHARAGMLATAGIGVALAVAFLPYARWQSTTPIESFKQVGASVDKLPPGPLIANSTRPLGLRYYIDREIQVVTGRTRLRAILCSDRAPIIIDHPTANTRIDPTCLQARGYRRQRFEQRRGGWIDLWIPPAAASGEPVAQSTPSAPRSSIT